VDYQEKASVLEIDTKAFIDSLTTNEKLRNVLAGNNVLYAGEPDKTPFYVHALILNSYIESSWKCINGGGQIAKLLSKNIHAHNGLIMRNAEVKKIVEAISKAAFTGQVGDGKIFIYPVADAVRIRTAERGDVAV